MSSSGGGSSGKELVEGSSSPTLSRYESQKRRDWNTFGQYLKNQRPPVPLSHCNCNHVLDFLREVRECQAKARGIPYKKKKKVAAATTSQGSSSKGNCDDSSPSTTMHYS
ncbi:hypothetical protein AAHE18_08G156600 [Arachis hypogaea]